MTAGVGMAAVVAVQANMPWAEHLSGKALDQEQRLPQHLQSNVLLLLAATAADAAAPAFAAQAAAAIGQGSSVASLQAVPGLCLLTMLLQNLAPTLLPAQTAELAAPCVPCVLSMNSITGSQSCTQACCSLRCTYRQQGCCPAGSNGS